MNLTNRYMEKVIWSNVLDFKVCTRPKPKQPLNVFTFLFGAPEVMSQDKRYALTIYFKNCIPPELIKDYLHFEYQTINFVYKNATFVIIHDGAVTYTYIDNNSLIVEMNAVDFEWGAVKICETEAV